MGRKFKITYKTLIDNVVQTDKVSCLVYFLGNNTANYVISGNTMVMQTQTKAQMFANIATYLCSLVGNHICALEIVEGERIN